MATSTPLLLLDDDPVMRSLLAMLLAAEGFAPAVTATLPEALAALTGSPAVELVLTDLQMPGVEPLALAGQLRQALPADAVLLAMSGTMPVAEVRELFDGFVLKPFDAARLRAAEREARLRRGSAASAESGGSSPSHPGPVLDEAIFHSLAAAIPTPKLLELYEMTLADVLQRQKRMVAAAETGDRVVLRQEAHTTKGSCGMVGARELEKLAAQIEGGTSDSTPQIAEIPIACERLRGILAAKLK